MARGHATTLASFFASFGLLTLDFTLDSILPTSSDSSVGMSYCSLGNAVCFQFSGEIVEFFSAQVLIQQVLELDGGTFFWTPLYSAAKTMASSFQAVPTTPIH